MVADAAGNDPAEVVERRVDVDGDPVERHPAANPDADGRDLVFAPGAEIRSLDPDADPALPPLAGNAEYCEGADDPLLES